MKNGKLIGVSSMYKFRVDPDLGIGNIAINIYTMRF